MFIPSRFYWYNQTVDIDLLFFHCLYFAWQFIDLLLMFIFKDLHSTNKELKVSFYIKNHPLITSYYLWVNYWHWKIINDYLTIASSRKILTCNGLQSHSKFTKCSKGLAFSEHSLFLLFSRYYYNLPFLLLLFTLQSRDSDDKKTEFLSPVKEKIMVGGGPIWRI